MIVTWEQKSSQSVENLTKTCILSPPPFDFQFNLYSESCVGLLEIIFLHVGTPLLLKYTKRTNNPSNLLFVSLSDMEAATSTLQHPYGVSHRGPNPPHGAQQAQGPHQPGPGPSGATRPEEQQQQHHKPFFFIQPSQTYLPMQNLQWPVPMPMPVSYNLYYGYPSLGKLLYKAILCCM